MVRPEDPCPEPNNHDAVTIPEIQEFAEVSTRLVETGTVRITKHVHEVQRTFHPTLHDHRVHITRVPINKVVKSPPEIRTEGNTTIIPVVEEVLVKLLLLKEEVHVTNQTVEKLSPPRDVTLRREEVQVQREPSHTTDKST